MLAATNGFEGFPAEAFTFFDQLARNNEREWFQARKDLYERSCREPMKRLVAALGVDPADARISRINRDLRFSPNRAPYKTYIAAGVNGHYISLSAAGLFVGLGLYRPDGPVLARYRSAVDDQASGRALEKIVASLQRKRYQVDTHERLASVPRGYAADHPRLDLLRMKGLYAGKTFEPARWLATPRAVDRVEQVMADVKPLGEWLRAHVNFA